jgi:transcriptional regulator with XRE-family HTH domain
VTSAPDAFGTFGERLRAQRESQGVSLNEIARTTKIGLSLLVALERNDLSRWPKGIFRRAFFREYVTAIGLSPEPMLAEFARLFPENPVPESVETDELRLVLDTHRSGRETGARMLVALVELLGVVLTGVVTGWALDVHAMTMSGIVALVYYPVANACLDRTRVHRVVRSDRFEWMSLPAWTRNLPGITWLRRTRTLSGVQGQSTRVQGSTATVR